MSGGDLVAVNNEIAVIEEAIGDRSSEYWSNNDLQQRYRALLSARDEGTAPPPPVPARQKEIQRLHDMMADRNSEYWRGPEAEKNQARYRELIRGGGVEPGLVVGTGDTALLAVESEIDAIEETMRSNPAAYWRDEAMQSRYRDLLTSLSGMLDDLGARRSGNQPAPLPGLDGYTADPAAPSRAVEAAVSIMSKLSPSDRFDLAEAWDWALPEAAKGAAVAELASPPSFMPPASPADVERFRTDPDNADIAQAWGRAAPTRLGALQTRLRRILSALSPSDRQQATHWLNTAPHTQYAAIVRHLAGG